LNSFLNRLNIRCDFNEFGCNSIITLESLSAHVSQCNYNPEKALPCEKGCGILLTVKQKSGHNCVLEDILVTIDNQNERIANLEKILEKNNAFIHQRLEALEKKNDSFKQLEIKYKFLENKYERLASCVSQLTLNSSGLNTGILALEENQSLSTSNG
jgi:E3 ubiquitin-protein ligase NRDP1